LEPEIVKSSLTHLNADERDELLRHFAGVVTWQSLCSTVDLKYEALPDTVTARECHDLPPIKDLM
jgi:hypothetical protein